MQQISWQGLSASERGASHIKNDMGNQDYVIMQRLPSEGYVVAVADGHGHKRHFRSAEGARIACEQMVALLTSIPASIFEATSPMEIYLEECKKKLIFMWLQEITAYQEQHPWSEEELELARRYNYGGVDNPRASFRGAYGTTLIAFVVRPEGLIAFHLGDGDLIALFPGGAAKEMRPLLDQDIANSDEFSGSATQSLCADYPLPHFYAQAFTPERMPLMICASSDGLSNCFRSDEYFFKFCRSMYETALSDGLDVLSGELSALLPDLTARGSGDDITLAFAYCIPHKEGNTCAQP